jgi:hypothetical protein
VDVLPGHRHWRFALERRPAPSSSKAPRQAVKIRAGIYGLACIPPAKGRGAVPRMLAVWVGSGAMAAPRRSPRPWPAQGIKQDVLGLDIPMHQARCACPRRDVCAEEAFRLGRVARAPAPSPLGMSHHQKCNGAGGTQS